MAGVAAEQLGMAFVRKDENSGFAATVNVGLEVARASGADAVLVNADIEFTHAGWLDVMQARTDQLGRPAAVVGARLLFPNGLLQHAGVYVSRLGRGFQHRFLHGPGDLPEALVPCACPVTGALQLIRHETLVQVGLYDESFGLGFEDVDYCLRVFAAGEACIYEPAAVADPSREPVPRQRQRAHRRDAAPLEPPAEREVRHHRPVRLHPPGPMTPLPRTLFVGLGTSAVAWYRAALPAMALGADWVGVARRAARAAAS